MVQGEVKMLEDALTQYEQMIQSTKENWVNFLYTEQTRVKMLSTLEQKCERIKSLIEANTQKNKDGN